MSPHMLTGWQAHSMTQQAESANHPFEGKTCSGTDTCLMQIRSQLRRILTELAGKIPAESHIGGIGWWLPSHIEVTAHDRSQTEPKQRSLIHACFRIEIVQRKCAQDHGGHMRKSPHDSPRIIQQAESASRGLTFRTLVDTCPIQIRSQLSRILT